LPVLFYGRRITPASSKDIKKIKVKKKQHNMDLWDQTRCFSDPEEAKQWLIGKITVN